MAVMVLLWWACLLLLCQEAIAKDSLQVAKQFQKAVLNVAAGDPSSRLWTAKSRQRPLPTNKFWQNFVLNNGSAPEYVHPYSIQSRNGSIAISFPKRLASAKSITQVHTDDLVLSSREASSYGGGGGGGGGGGHVVHRYDDLSVTLGLGRMRVPLVRGSPYVSFLFSEGIPVFSTNHSVLNVSKSFDSTKHAVYMNNGQKWLIYSSSPLKLKEDLSTSDVFSGVIRVAVVDPENPSAEPILDSFSKCYATNGRALYDGNADVARISYVYKTQGDGELLLLSLPLHRGILVYGESGARPVPQVKYSSIDGELQGVVGSTWVLQTKAGTSSIGWHSTSGVRDPIAAGRIGVALAHDVANLKPVDTSSTYYFGKAIARAARLALIAEEIGLPNLAHSVAGFLDENLSPWFDGSAPGNAIVYDDKWGGLVSQQGAFDSGADFGLGVYNDHHYHWGYFVYAGAVLAKLDPSWGERYRTNLYSLVADYMSVGRRGGGGGGGGESPSNFPRIRHFDPWVMHSWAGGLTEFADGRNQESTSEAVNAYYAASLMGSAFRDGDLARLGIALAGFESWGAKSLWHVREDSGLYEPEYVKQNRVTGVLWANKRDSGLWFACPSPTECKVGIQVIPITPMTEVLFDDTEYNQQLYSWASPSLATDSWKGFAYALQATYDPLRAKANVEQLQSFDDGNSLSNLLWWVYSRPAAQT